MEDSQNSTGGGQQPGSRGGGWARARARGGHTIGTCPSPADSNMTTETSASLTLSAGEGSHLTGRARYAGSGKGARKGMGGGDPAPIKEAGPTTSPTASGDIRAAGVEVGEQCCAPTTNVKSPAHYLTASPEGSAHIEMANGGNDLGTAEAFDNGRGVADAYTLSLTEPPEAPPNAVPGCRQMLGGGGAGGHKVGYNSPVGGWVDHPVPHRSLVTSYSWPGWRVPEHGGHGPEGHDAMVPVPERSLSPQLPRGEGARGQVSGGTQIERLGTADRPSSI
ncbi:unnamed protein product [Discosporangium mesarthrocarpum]